MEEESMKSTSKVMRLSVVAVCLIAAAVLLTPNDASAASCYTTKSGDWNDTSVWGGCGSNYPGQSTNDYVTIKNGHTVTLNTSPGAIYFLEIEGGATFDGSSNTLTISSSGGTPGILRNGTFTAGTGTVLFNSSYGVVVSTVSSSITFYNMTITGTGANFGSSSTVNGTLTINPGGYVSTNPPTYGSASTLKYNTGGTRGRGLEWSATSGAGYPANVQISSSTTLDLSNGGSANRQMAGSLTIDTGSTLSMGAMTNSLTVLGSVTNNGTLTLSAAGSGDLFLDFRGKKIDSLTVNGREIEPNWNGYRLWLAGG